MLDLFRQTIAAAISGVFVVLAYRRISAQSTAIGIVVASGVLLRASLGMLLFWVSYLDLPIFRSAHLGNGFWVLMADAQGYYMYASGVITNGWHSLDPGAASPFYTRTLAVWMYLVGSSPAVGILLNVSLNVALVLLLVALFKPQNAWRHDMPCIVAVVGICLGPLLIIHGTQMLKDDLFDTLVAMACVASMHLLKEVHVNRPRVRRFVWWSIILAAAIYAIAGIRAYYDVIIFAALAIAICLSFVRLPLSRLPEAIPTSAVMLAIVWLAYVAGAGPYYRGPTRADFAEFHPFKSNLSTLSRQMLKFSKEFMVMTEQARAGFARTGGATNIVTSPASGREQSDDPTAERPFSASAAPSSEPSPEASQQIEEAKSVHIDTAHAELAHLQPVFRVHAGAPAPTSMAPPLAPDTVPHFGPARAFLGSVDSWRTLARGLGVIFIPISLLKGFSFVNFPGGRGLLPIADLDTLFLDCIFLSVIAMLYTRRHLVSLNLSFVIFALSLSLITAGLLGYVVTNFGTLVRMRSMVVVPLWVLVLAAREPTR